MGTSTGFISAEASSSLSLSGQCGVIIGGGEWTLAQTPTRPGQAMLRERLFGPGRRRSMGEGYWCRPHQSSTSMQRNMGFLMAHIAEYSTQQVSKTSASASVDVEISRGCRSMGTHVMFADQEETLLSIMVGGRQRSEGRWHESRYQCWWGQKRLPCSRPCSRPPNP